MTQHITQEQAEALADSSGVFDSGLDEFGEKLQALCNAAIQHYLDNCADGSLHELLRLGVAENKALQDKIANLEHSVRFAAALAQPASEPAQAVPEASKQGWKKGGAA